MSPSEDACEADYRSFRAQYDEVWNDGELQREGLRRQLRRYVTTHEASAPVCAGQFYQILAFLLVYDRHFPEAAEIIRTFLTGPGRTTSAGSRVQLLQQRGYAMAQLGELREGAQDYFTAATLANQVRASQGVRALVYAARSARLLDDYSEAQRYLNAAFDLIADSLTTSERRGASEGLALTQQAFLLERQLEGLREGPQRDALNRRLEAVTARALEVLPSADPQSLGFRSQMTNLYALAAANRGEHDEARRRSLPAFGLAERAGAMLPNALWAAWMARARIAELRGDFEDARYAARQAELEAVRLGRSASEAHSLEERARLAERAGDLEEAAALYRRAIQWRDLRRDRLGLQDWTTQMRQTRETAHRGLARVQYALGDPEAAFFTIDRTRARYLRDLRRHLDVRRRLGPEQQREADSLQHALENVRLALFRDDLDASARAEATVQVSTLQERLEALTSADSTNEEYPDLRSIQQALDRRGQILLSYLIDPEQSVAFVVRPDTFVAVPLRATPHSVTDLLTSAGSPWQSETAPPDPAFRLDALHHLYQELVAPVSDWIGDHPSVVVVPDGPLAGLPFGMLTTDPADEYSTAPYLVRRHAISTELAASMVTGTSEVATTSSPDFDVLIFARSRFGRSTWNDESLPDLPHVRDEVRGIRRAIGSTYVALDEDATEEALIDQISNARVVHLASHAETEPALPLFSRIALWEGPNEDGVLYLHELQGRALPAELVVLSGCSTARGAQRAGEGVVGLHYAVRSAGAQASLATLWAVDDRATVDLMAAFYDAMKDGLPKDRALQRAQLEYLEANDGLAASPFFWAAPVLAGNPEPVRLQGSRRWAEWTGALALAFGLGIAWALRRRRNA